MSESEENKQSDFLIEKIKERPVNKKKLLRRTLITAGMAVIFGLVACVTFLVLEPLISNWLYPEEPAQIVVFPQDQDEMSPEDMLSDNMQMENQANQNGDITESITLESEQIQDILSNVELNMDNYRQLYMAMSDYANELNRCMVTVTGVTSNIDWFHNVEKSSNQSSGVIVANNGKELLILVDYTPLRKAESLTLSFYNGTRVSAELKEEDEETSLAIVTVSLNDLDKDMVANDISVASLGSSNGRNIVGIPVVALGSPMGSSGSIGYGMITATGSLDTMADVNYKLLQTDINGSQNAGGVLFNLQGQVVGIITNYKPGSDLKNLIGAYGITELKKNIEKMSNGEEMAYLGICGMDVTAEVHQEWNVPFGAFVKEVEMDSPSMHAGIQQGDVLVAVGDRSIQSFGEYAAAVTQLKVGETVEITVMRQVQDDYKEVKFEVVPEKR